MERKPDIIRFGVDGWQARFDDAFGDESVVRVADALGLVWGDASPGATVYVGYDLRHDAAEHARLAAGVLASYGLRVRVSDAPCPTPVVAWIWPTVHCMTPAWSVTPVRPSSVATS